MTSPGPPPFVHAGLKAEPVSIVVNTLGTTGLGSSEIEVEFGYIGVCDHMNVRAVARGPQGLRIEGGVL